MATVVIMMALTPMRRTKGCVRELLAGRWFRGRMTWGSFNSGRSTGRMRSKNTDQGGDFFVSLHCQQKYRYSDLLASCFNCFLGWQCKRYTSILIPCQALYCAERRIRKQTVKSDPDACLSQPFFHQWRNKGYLLKLFTKQMICLAVWMY
jgi:hypothetical protein